jgi:cytochrome P450/NADPH-cytochrome P450 reductase
MVISTQALMNEICDEKRFTKKITGGIIEARNIANDGLFTAYTEEPNWGIAHRILMPAFGPLATRDMFNEMHDIASQLVMKWARFGPSERIDVGSDFTRMTLDTIALFVDRPPRLAFRSLIPFSGAPWTRDLIVSIAKICILSCWQW